MSDGGLGRFGSPPPSSVDVDVTAEQVEEYRDRGFLVVDGVTSADELAWIGAIYDACFDPDDDMACRTRWDTEDLGEATPVVTRSQAFFPERSVPALLETDLVRNGRRCAAALLGLPVEEIQCWSHMILKPSGVGRPTYWHQDESYWDPTLAHHALGVWTALDGCTVDMGCMQFPARVTSPGSA